MNRLQMYLYLHCKGTKHSQCGLQCFTSYMKKIPMFKIEYLPNYGNDNGYEWLDQDPLNIKL